MPKVHLGARTRYTIGREVTYAQPWTVTAWKELPFLAGESLKNSISSFTQNTISADRMYRGIAMGQHAPGGAIPYEFMSRGYLTLFQYALGGASDITQQGDDTLKRRVFWGAQDEATFPVSLESGDPESGRGIGGLTLRKWFLVENPSSDESLSPDSFMLEYVGTKVGGFSLAIPTDGLVTGSFDLMSTKEAVHDYYPGVGTSWSLGDWVLDVDNVGSGLHEINDDGEYVSTFASPDADRPITSVRLANDSSFTGYVMLGEQGASTAIATVQSANINFTNNPVRVQVVGQTESYSIEFGRRMISGDLTVALTDLSWYNYFRNETDLELKLKFDASYPGAADEYVEFVLPKIRIGGEGAEAPSPTVADAGPLSLTVPFQALRNESLITVSGTTPISIPEYTDIYMVVQLDGGLSTLAATEFAF
jgi:hypothetical protein